MRLALDNDEFSEVLIECNQNTTLSTRNGEHGLVSMVVVPIATPDDVMSEGLKLRFCAAPHARVK
jgi:hypothetical protein